MRTKSSLPPTVLCAALCAAASVAPAACSKPRSTSSTASAEPSATTAPPSTRIALKAVPSEEQRNLALNLGASADATRWTFAGPDADDPKNRPAVLFLAASSDSPAVIGAALRALAKMEAKQPSKGTEKADYEAVVTDHLGSSDQRIQGRALEATSAALRRNPQSTLAPVAATLLPKFTTTGGQYDLIEALSAAPLSERRAALEPLVKVIGQMAPFVAARLLEALTETTRSAPASGGLVAAVTPLLDHQDPMVRGRAAELLGSGGKGRSAVERALLEKLGDPDPFVRSKVVQALGRLGFGPAIHGIARLLDDNAADRIEVPAWKTLEGSVGRRVHEGTVEGSVSHAAVIAMSQLSDGKFRPDQVPPRDEKVGVHKKNVAAAKAWYQAHKAEFPKPDASAAASVAKPQTPPAKTLPASGTAAP